MSTFRSLVVEGIRLQSPPSTTPAGQLASAFPTRNWNYSAAEAVSADSWLAFRTKAGSYSFGPSLAHCSTCVLYCICLPSLSPALALLLCPALEALKRYWPREVSSARNITNQQTKIEVSMQRRKRTKENKREHRDQSQACPISKRWMQKQYICVDAVTRT